MDKAVLITQTSLEELSEHLSQKLVGELGSLAQVKDSEPNLLTRKETADFLKISLVCLHEWCKKGILHPKKLGTRTYFFKSEILEILNQSNTC